MSSTAFTIRDAVPADLPALADLHVRTFNETHAPVAQNGPTFAIREHQWRQAFSEPNPTWFCYVIEDEHGALIGFAKGQPYTDGPDFDGLLNKIYILRAYHRRGLGRRLIGHVARRFLSQGMSSMILFGDAANESNKFYDAMGGARLYAKNGDFHGGYGWRDLRGLVEICPPE